MTTRLLVLGGTGFVGPAILDDALARGWDVTCFNRGTRPARVGVRVLVGDRAARGGLAALDNGRWDIAVDTWASAPIAVHDAARTLADRVDRFVYVSSRSVYEWPMPAGGDESLPVTEGTPTDGDVAYPAAKAGGERAAVTAFGDRALLARAGLILGPRENIGRLPWWLQRVAAGGPVLAPGPPDSAVQFVDARDLAAFVLDAAARSLSGPFDVVCPVGHATMRDVLDACVTATGSGAELRWVPPAPILAAGAEPWTDLPIWIPPGESHDAMHRSDVSKALAAGLRCRPVDQTVADTWAWMQQADRPTSQPDRDYVQPVGLDPSVEARILAEHGL